MNAFPDELLYKLNVEFLEELQGKKGRTSEETPGRILRVAPSKVPMGNFQRESLKNILEKILEKTLLESTDKFLKEFSTKLQKQSSVDFQEDLESLFLFWNNTWNFSWNFSCNVS